MNDPDTMDEHSTFNHYFQADPTLQFGEAQLHWQAGHFVLLHYRDAFFYQQALPLPPALSSAIDKRRSEYFAGRYLAKRALLTAGSPTFTVAADPNRCPLWPDGFCGTISHTDTYAASVVARREQIAALGMDIQDWLDEDSARRVAGRILDDAERAVLAADKISLSQGVSLCFSAKESIYKALYPYIGHHFGYAAAKLLRIEPDRGQLHFAFSPTLHPPGLDCATLSLHYQPRKKHVVTLLALRAA